MSPILTTILALVSAAPSAITQITALWQALRSGASTSDQATVDAVLAALTPKTDADVAKLNLDATQASQ